MVHVKFGCKQAYVDVWRLSQSVECLKLHVRTNRVHAVMESYNVQCDDINKRECLLDILDDM